MRHIEKIVRSDQGLTLVEVLIAVFILGVVMVGTVATFAKCNVFIAEMRQHSIATKALNEAMEEIRGMTFAQILSLDSNFSTSGLGQLDDPDAACTLTLDDPFSDANIRRVTLALNWTSPQGRALTKRFAALVTPDGVGK